MCLLRSVLPPVGLLGAAACLAAGTPAAATTRNELGRPVVRHYTPGEHFYSKMSHAVTQDASGVMWFGNAINVISFDGAQWDVRRLSEQSAGVRQFAVAADGTIFLGGPGVIGYLRGTGREARFVSLHGQLPAGAGNIDELTYTLAIGNTVYFSDEAKILRWREGRMTVVPFLTPPRSGGARLHRVGDALHVTALGRGLGRLLGDQVTIIADDPVLRENQIISVEAGEGGTLVLLTAERGFFQLAADGRVSPLPVAANRWLTGKRIFRALRLADGSRVVAFSAVSGDGGMRLGADGSYLGPLDTSIGIVVKAIRDFFCDREGGLWLGTDAGAARLEWPSAVSIFDSMNGLGQGAVTDVARHDGELFAATSEGLFRLTPAEEGGRGARFERLRGQPVFSLLSHAGGLLAAGYAEVFLAGAARPATVARVPPGGATLLPSRRDPARVWVGTTQDLRALRHTPQGWRDDGVVPGLSGNCRGLSESADGTLWVWTVEPGLVRVTWTGTNLAESRIERLAGGVGPTGQVARTDTVKAGNEALFAVASAARPFRFGVGSRRFEAIAGVELSPAIGAEDVWTDGGDEGTLWLAGPAGIFRVQAGTDEWQRLPHVVPAAVGAVARLREEKGAGGEVLWVCGASGLARVEVARAFVPPVPFTAQVWGEPLREGDRLSPAHPAMTFRYVAPRQRPTSPVSYQTRLDGLEKEWSEWSNRRERTYSVLPAGSYRFEVRARDAEGQLAAPARLSFVVLPPWWRTPWAIAGYLLAGGGLIAGVVQLRTRTLRQHAQRLEGLVAERTAALARQNAELIRLHRLDLDEKIAARLAEEKSRLEVLRYQLNPHFLFNTLASIRTSLAAENATARSMVDRLAEFCRLTLHRGSDRDWTTLAEELRLLRSYLDIEQSRSGELLHVAFATDPALDAERLPHFLLLPLVENALKYGRATSTDRIGVRLTTRRHPDGALMLEVANTGVWVEPGKARPDSSLGIGLDNLRERLERYYPHSHQLDIVAADGWVTVTLKIMSADPGKFAP